MTQAEDDIVVLGRVTTKRVSLGRTSPQRPSFAATSLVAGVVKTYYTTDGSTPTSSSPVYKAESKPVLARDARPSSTSRPTRPARPERTTRRSRTSTRSPPRLYGRKRRRERLSQRRLEPPGRHRDIDRDDLPQLGAATSSGVDHTYYKLDPAAATARQQPHDLGPGDHSDDGTHTVSFYSTDKAGNTESTRTFTVKIDTRAFGAPARPQRSSTRPARSRGRPRDRLPPPAPGSRRRAVREEAGDSTFTLAHTNTDGSSSFN